MKHLMSCLAFCLQVFIMPLSPAMGQTPTTGSLTLPASPEFSKLTQAQVLSVVDGDTVHLMVNGKDTTCRLIGIDTPETKDPRKPVQAYGQQASDFLENLLSGELVWVSTQSTDNIDKYGRLLVYLYRCPDGLFVNLEIIRQGYGHAYTVYPFKHMETFRAAERKARETGKGLWKIKPEEVSLVPTPAPEAVPLAVAPVAVAPVQSVQNVQQMQHQTQQQPPQDQGQLVYITKTGAKYHRDGCRHLKSRISISLQDARSRGYTACAVCRP